MAAPLAESKSLISGAAQIGERAAGRKSRVAVCPPGSRAASGPQTLRELSPFLKPSPGLPHLLFPAKTPNSGVTLLLSRGGQGAQRFLTVPAGEGHTGGPEAVVFTPVTVVGALFGGREHTAVKFHIHKRISPSHVPPFSPPHLPGAPPSRLSLWVRAGVWLGAGSCLLKGWRQPSLS